MGDLRDWDVVNSDGSVRMDMRLFHGANLHLSKKFFGCQTRDQGTGKGSAAWKINIGTPTTDIGKRRCGWQRTYTSTQPCFR